MVWQDGLDHPQKYVPKYKKMFTKVSSAQANLLNIWQNLSSINSLQWKMTKRCFDELPIGPTLHQQFQWRRKSFMRCVPARPMASCRSRWHRKFAESPVGRKARHHWNRRWPEKWSRCFRKNAVDSDSDFNWKMYTVVVVGIANFPVT